MTKFKLTLPRKKDAKQRLPIAIRPDEEMEKTLRYLSEKTDLSLNKIVIQCVSFALENMEHEPQGFGAAAAKQRR